MSTYDNLAFSNRPRLYLSAPQTTDKSGTGAFPLSNNNLSATGQPIIFGNSLSFNISSTAKVDVTGNPLFFNTTATFECVIYASRPTQEVPIIIDSNAQNALLITPDGITLKLFFDNLLSTYSQSTTVKVKDWNKKLYILVTVTDSQATLSVNADSNMLSYKDAIVPSTNVTIGGGYSGYSYLMDGIGLYSSIIQNKLSVINDPWSGYSSYASRKHSGRTTKFQGYQRGTKQVFGLDKFSYRTSSDGDQYTLSYLVSQVHQGLDYIIVRANDERITVNYDVNFAGAGTFTEYLLLGSIDEATLRLTVDSTQVDNDFSISIETVYNGDVLYETPAELELTGLALYSDSEESIVNAPDGIKLPQATYNGTWILDQSFPSTPMSVEIVFKPINAGVRTYVFHSTDGSASFGPSGSISGFTAYLNGQVVTDLTGVKYDQWNHLVLVDVTPSATEFYLNSNNGVAPTTTISYMLLTAYPGVLSAGSVTMLYNIISGTDIVSIDEPITIAEGVFSGGQAFNAYSYAWAIMGAGGS
jgi:hypothetical protein